MIRIAHRSDPDPVSAALYRAVDSYLRTVPQALCDAWSFRTFCFPCGDCFAVGDGLAIIDPPFSIPPDVGARLIDVLGDMADLVGGVLNPPETERPRVFIVAAFSKNDRVSGRALTNALDVELACRIIARGDCAPTPRRLDS